MKKNKKRKKIKQQKLSRRRKYRRYPRPKSSRIKEKVRIKSGFKDNFGRMHQYDELIFPIIYHNEKTDKYHAIGTGYFFHSNGGFITAKHVLFDKGKLLTPCYAIQTLDTGERIKREIRIFFPHPDADIGVGMLRGQLYQDGKEHLLVSLAISLTPPNIGDKISTYAFPKSEIVIEDDAQVGVFQGTWSKGEIKKLVKAGEHHLLKTDSFETNMHIAARASGGPVLRGIQIIGVNSTGWELVEGEDPVSNITPVHEILDMIIKNGDGSETTVRKLMETGHVQFHE